MWPYRKVTYVHCAWVLYLVEKKQVLPWVDSVLCGVPRSLELLTFFFSAFPSPSFSLTIPGIEEGTEDQCETVRNCTWRPRLAHLFSIYFCFCIFFLSFATTLLTKASFLLYFSFSLLFTLLSFSLTILGIEEGTGDQCETVRNCTWRPRLAHLFSIHFLGPSPILLSLSFSFPGIEERTVHAGLKWQIAEQA